MPQSNTGFKVGDIVRCIDNGHPYLDYGAEYVVVKAYKSPLEGSLICCVETPTGNSFGYYQSRFVLVKPYVKKRYAEREYIHA